MDLTKYQICTLFLLSNYFQAKTSIKTSIFALFVVVLLSNSVEESEASLIQNLCFVLDLTMYWTLWFI